MRVLWRWLVLVVLLAPGEVGAVQSSALGAYPTDALGSSRPWFHYNLAAGHSVEGSVTVDNRSPDVQDVLLYAVDAAPNGDGGFGMMPQNQRPNDAGSWVHLDTSGFRLLPHTQQNVGFHVVAPAHPSVGTHYAGIIVQPTQPTTAGQRNFRVQIIARLGVRMYVTVPGYAHPILRIQALQPSSSHHKVSVVTTLRNSGNTLLTPVGKLQLSPWLEKPTTLRFNAGQSLQPDQQLVVTVPTSITSSGFPHRYTAQLSLRYGDPAHYRTEVRSVTFWTGNVTAWAIALSLVLLAVSAGFAVKYGAYRHRNRNRRDQR